MQIVGMDLARPGSDMTVLAELRDGVVRVLCLDMPDSQPHSTATEINIRLAEYMAKHGHLYERMRKSWPLRVSTMKVACIKYGRRKAKSRCAFGKSVDLLSGKMWQWN